MTLSLLDWLLLALSAALALACVWYERHCAALAVARGVVDELAAVATNWDFPLAPTCSILGSPRPSSYFSKRV